MANRPSMCLIVLFAAVGKFHVVVSDGPEMNTPPITSFPTIITPLAPPPADVCSTQDSKICPNGKWYAVMATEVSSNDPCNIVTNNKAPCSCTSMDIRELADSSWEVIGSSENMDTLVLTAHMGAASAETPDNKELNGFIIGQASVPATVLEVFPQITITQNVNGCPMFTKYHLSIIDWNAENFYMITQLKTSNAPDPFYIIWCRKTHPGKATIWTSILEGLKKLNIDPHSMSFIKQDNCTIPTLFQYDEMFFC
ncbi:Calycin [Cinara cedri]|uniref:Calycin n=1 Tax=Cinara cedri TaxID=506608 RepID=A0A5E4MLU2_9HEMI|nr:Calycin [Cinara cedri]